MPLAATQLGVTAVVYGDKYLSSAQEMTLWGLTLVWLWGETLPRSEEWDLTPLLLLNVMVLMCLGHERYLVVPGNPQTAEESWKNN